MSLRKFSASGESVECTSNCRMKSPICMAFCLLEATFALIRREVGRRENKGTFGAVLVCLWVVVFWRRKSFRPDSSHRQFRTSLSWCQTAQGAGTHFSTSLLVTRCMPGGKLAREMVLGADPMPIVGQDTISLNANSLSHKLMVSWPTSAVGPAASTMSLASFPP